MAASVGNAGEVSDSEICKICKGKQGKYTCPRCHVLYCSVLCYQSVQHAECSEAFYRDCVMEEMESHDTDPRTKQKMMEILTRFNEQEQPEELDSDDEEDQLVPDLTERLAGVSLSNADAVWEKLTEEERREFEELIQNGDVSQLVPSWKPWWIYRKENKLIEEVKVADTAGNVPAYIADCPPVKAGVPAFSKLSKTRPSSCVKFGLMNILYSYAYIVRYYNGDHHEFVPECVNALVLLSGNLSRGRNYDSAEMAVEAAAQEVLSQDCLAGSKELIQDVKKDVRCILEGPEEENPRFYVLSSLSDIHRLLVEAKQALSKPSKGSELKHKGGFSRKFVDHSAINFTQIPKDKLKLLIRKIEYYLSWVRDYGHELNIGIQ